MQILPTEQKFSLVDALFAPKENAGISFAEELRSAIDRPAAERPRTEPVREEPREGSSQRTEVHEGRREDRDEPAAARAPEKTDSADAPRDKRGDKRSRSDRADAAPAEGETAKAGERKQAKGNTGATQDDAGAAGDKPADPDAAIIAAAASAVGKPAADTSLPETAAATAVLVRAALAAGENAADVAGRPVTATGTGQAQAGQQAAEAQAQGQTQQTLTASAQAAAARPTGQIRPDGNGKGGEIRVDIVNKGEPVVSRPGPALAPNAAPAAAAAQGGGQQSGNGNAAGQQQAGANQMIQGQNGNSPQGATADPASSFSQALQKAQAEIDGRAVDRPATQTGADARPAAGAAGTAQAGAGQAAARAAAAAPARPAPQVPVAEQVTVRIVNAVNQGAERVQIQLRPEHLGRVEVKLDFGHDGRVHTTVTADRPDTLAQLQRDSGALERALQQAGLNTDSGSMNFNLRQGGRQNAGADHGQRGLPGGDAGEQPLELVQNGNDVVVSGDRGIDIRI
ncbi:MAG: flagellar hook-length control protein FliK [Acetobacterales bacterium]